MTTENTYVSNAQARYGHLTNEDIVDAIRRSAEAHGLDMSLFSDGRKSEALEQAVRASALNEEEAQKAERIISTCSAGQMRGYLLLRIEECRELYEVLLEKNNAIISEFCDRGGKVGGHARLEGDDIKSEFALHLIGEVLSFDSARAERFTTFLGLQLHACRKKISEKRAYRIHQEKPMSSEGEISHSVGTLDKTLSREENPLDALLHADLLEKASKAAMDSLTTEREKQIVQLRIQEGLSQEETGKHIEGGASKNRVSQMEKVAINKMAAALEPYGIKTASLFSKPAPKAAPDAYLTDDFILDEYHLKGTEREKLYHAIMQEKSGGWEKSRIFDKFVVAGILAGHSDTQITARFNVTPVKEENFNVGSVSTRRNRLAITLAASDFMQENAGLLENMKQYAAAPLTLKRFISELERHQKGGAMSHYVNNIVNSKHPRQSKSGNHEMREAKIAR